MANDELSSGPSSLPKGLESAEGEDDDVTFTFHELYTLSTKDNMDVMLGK